MYLLYIYRPPAFAPSLSPFSANSDVANSNNYSNASKHGISSSSRCSRRYIVWILHIAFDMYAKCLSSLPKIDGRMPNTWPQQIIPLQSDNDGYIDGFSFTR